MDDEERACEGAETRTRYNAMGDFEECYACETGCRWDLVDHPFFGFKNACPKKALTSDRSIC